MRLMAGSQGLPAMGELYCLAASWSQWRPLDIPGTYLPYSTMQLLTIYLLSSIVKLPTVTFIASSLRLT